MGWGWGWRGMEWDGAGLGEARLPAPLSRMIRCLPATLPNPTPSMIHRATAAAATLCCMLACNVGLCALRACRLDPALQLTSLAFSAFSSSGLGCVGVGVGVLQFWGRPCSLHSGTRSGSPAWTPLIGASFAHACVCVWVGG